MAIESEEQKAKSENVEKSKDSKTNDFSSTLSARCPVWQQVVKRLMDLLLPLAALPVILPLGLMLALAVKLDSRGPVFFKQTRIGKDGKPFTLYKFRSMHKDADKMRSDLDHLNEAAGPVFKIKRDPRITRMGMLLRRSSMDELPQIMNVIKGEMSLVGPRPPLPREVEKYTPYQRGRLAVKPGLTCLWQVQGRSKIGFDKWVELDLEYIRNQSLWLDLKILLKTVPAVLKGTGAW